MDRESEVQKRTIGQIIGEKIDHKGRLEGFNLYAMSCDFADKCQFRSGKEVRKLALAMLEGNTKVHDHLETAMFPGGPIGLMQFTQSMVRTRMTDPNFRLRLNDVEGLFDKQMVIALPLNNMDLQGSTITPHELRQVDLSDTNAEGVEIKADLVSDVRTNANTNLRDAKIEANGIVDLKLAPGADCRGIEITPGKTYMGNNWALKAEIEGALLEGARLPGDLSGVKGAMRIPTQFGSDPDEYMINAGDGVFLRNQYGSGLTSVAEELRYVLLKQPSLSQDTDKIGHKWRAVINELSGEYGRAKDWPMAAQTREEIRAVLAEAEADPHTGNRRLSQYNLSMPAEQDIKLAGPAQDADVIRPAAFAAS